jgi:predicted type IV restriction endonuclease
MTTSHNQAFSRILIDNALKASGWNLLDQQQVRFEHNVANGRADYPLIDNLGRVLCVLKPSAKTSTHTMRTSKPEGKRA